MIAVWHLKDDVTREQRMAVTWIVSDDDLIPVVKAWKASAYEKVAEVASDDLEVAWHLTNNIESSWSMEPDPKVTVMAPLHVINGETYGRKSSAVGDVFVQDDVAYVVAAVGMKRLPLDGA